MSEPTAKEVLDSEIGFSNQIWLEIAEEAWPDPHSNNPEVFLGVFAKYQPTILRALRVLAAAETYRPTADLADQIDEHMRTLDHSGPTEALTTASDLIHFIAAELQEEAMTPDPIAEGMRLAGTHGDTCNGPASNCGAVAAWKAASSEGVK